MKRLVIGLTGGVGSGKSSVAELFAERGIAVIDADALSHRLTAAGGAAIAPIRTAFGAAMLTAEGALDRARMRALVFRDEAAKRKLEAILHPLIAQAAEREKCAARSPYLIHMIPLLIEGGAARARVDRILVVDCPEETQIARVMQRSGLTRTEVEAIMATQVARAERLAHADDIVDNSGSRATLAPQVERLHQRYLHLAEAG